MNYSGRLLLCQSGRTSLRSCAEPEYGIISGNVMAEASKEINIECPAAYSLQQEDGTLQSEGQASARLDSSGLTLYPESGEELMVTYRNILGFSGADYRIMLTLTSKNKIVLAELGYQYENFLRILSQLRNEMLLKDMLMEEFLKSSWKDVGFVCRDRAGVEFSGSCELRLYDTGLVVMPEFGELIRIPYSDILDIKAGDYVLTLTTEESEVFAFSQLGRNFDPFRAALLDSMNELAINAQAILNEALPELDSLLLRKAAQFMKEGRAAMKHDLDKISPEIWNRLEKRLSAFGLAEEYDFLKSLAQGDKLCIGIKRGLMGDLTGEYVWFLIPICSEDTAKPGNAVAMEADSEAGEGKATYFFRIMPRQDYRNSKDLSRMLEETDRSIRTINRCMIEINFRREPVYLSDERLQEAAYVKYLFAVQKLRSLRFLRDRFIGRVVHASREQWRKDVLDLLKFNIEADYDNQKWKKEV
jgi:hypothetical protein